MKTSNNYLIIIFIGVFLTCNINPGECITFAVPPSGFHHFWFVQTWRYGYCSNPRFNCDTSKLEPIFTIHGLWAVNASGATITTSGPSVNITDLLKNHTALRNDMSKYWVSLSKTQSNEDFWLYQYTHHGYGSPGVFEGQPLAYFNSSIQLYKSAELLETLEKGNVKPNGTTYPKGSYDEALKAKFGKNHNFIFRCITKNNVSLLSEVIICVDAKAQNFISCDGSVEMSKNNCPENFKFPKEIEA